MKFLKEEHKSIAGLFNELNIDKSAYQFRKKGGMLLIDMEGKEVPFYFFRKTESHLNSDLQFEDKVTYYIGVKKGTSVDSWDEVLKAKKDWA